MRLPLLEQKSNIPDQVPMRTRIGQALVSESDFAISMPGVPRQLPTTYLPENYGNEQNVALARLGGTVNEVATRTLDLVLEAQIRKRDANDLAQAEELYKKSAEAGIDAVTNRARTEGHTTFQPAYEADWQHIASEALASAQNPRVHALLAQKLRTFELAQYREVNAINRQKFRDYQEASFNETVTGYKDRMSKAATEIQRETEQKQFESYLAGKAATTLKPPDELAKVKKSVLEDVEANRVGFQFVTATSPSEVVPVLRQLRGGESSLPQDRINTLIAQGESRLRTLLSDQDMAANQLAKEQKAKQDALASDYRAAIFENYAEGGLGRSFLSELNARRPELGETNHSQLLQLDRELRKDFLHPGPKRDDSNLAAEILTRYRKGDVNSFDDEDLLRLKTSDQINRDTFLMLSEKRAEEVRRQAAAANKPETTAEKQRKDDIQKAYKFIETKLMRGSALQGDDRFQTTKMLVNAAQEEFDARVAANPNLSLQDIAEAVVLNRAAKVPRDQRAWPYQSEAEVDAEYAAGRLPKNEADFWKRLLRATGEGGNPKRGQAPTPPTTPPPAPPSPAPGWLERFQDLLKGKDTLQPAKP